MRTILFIFLISLSAFAYSQDVPEADLPEGISAKSHRIADATNAELKERVFRVTHDIEHGKATAKTLKYANLLRVELQKRLNIADSKQWFQSLAVAHDDGIALSTLADQLK